MKKLFLLIGSPGSGKTTNAEIVAKNNQDKMAHYSTGQLLRDEVKKGSDLGKEIDSYISKGNLCPLNVVVNTIVSALKNCDKDVVLIDGYPRSKEQMVSLDEILQKEDSIKLCSVIEVVVSEDVAKNRVLGRARGSDDNESVFYNRMEVYLKPLKEIQKFYKGKSILKPIDASRSIQEVVDDVEEFIKRKI